MVKVKTYREFSKILRKYFKRNFRKRKPFIWYPWVSYMITKHEEVEKLKHTKLYKNSINLKTILNEFEELNGKLCLFEGFMVGRLIGIEITNEDFYYIYEEYDTDVIRCQSCCGGLNRESDFNRILNDANITDEIKDFVRTEVMPH